MVRFKRWSYKKGLFEVVLCCPSPSCMASNVGSIGHETPIAVLLGCSDDLFVTKLVAELRELRLCCESCGTVFGPTPAIVAQFAREVSEQIARGAPWVAQVEAGH